jgi:phage terminase large subunit-like protein
VERIRTLDKILSLSDTQRKTFIKSLTKDEAERFMFDWDIWGRDKQHEPEGDWTTWLLLAGRGFGKTRTGAEWIRKNVEEGKARRIAFIAPTAADARDIMVEGESGILAISPPWNMPLYEPSKRRLSWKNGAIATMYSADEPERLRGPNHDLAWADELCSWRHPSAFDMLLFGLRLGENPRLIITTTPKPTILLKQLIKEKTTAITKGTTYENQNNLAKIFIKTVLNKYEGTRLGRQELRAEVLDDTVGALWKLDTIDKYKVKEAPELKRIIVAIDPAVSTNATSDETGIIVAGLGTNDEGYILDDLTIKGSPMEWATAAITAYHKWQADKIIGEANNGGDMVKFTLETIDSKVPIRLVHAARGKQTRAEPISALYDQGKVHHVGSLPLLEDQMTCWIPGEGSSPDRVDALVWAIWELMIDGRKKSRVFEESFGGITSASTWGVV